MAREGALEDPAVPSGAEGPPKRLPCSQNAPHVTGEGLHPDVGDLKMPKVAQSTSEAPDVAAETPNPDVRWARNGHRTLRVDSDTDVEEEEEGPNPDVGPHKWLRMTQNVPETPDVGLKPPNPDVPWLQGGHGALLVESDTDVEEEEEAGAEVEPPEQLKTARNVPETPDVAGKTPNPDVLGPKTRRRMVPVDSDTDVDEGQDVQPQKRPKVTQNVPGIPDVEVGAPGPAVRAPGIGRWRTLMDSDTDVEGEEEDPDVRPQSQLRMPQNVSQTPDVAAEPLDPDVSGPELRSQVLLVDSDTDVDDDANPDVPPPKRLRVAPSAPGIPDVEVATPNPAVARPKVGRGTLVEGSDTDVEEDPDVQPPKRPRRTQRLPETPDVRWGMPHPDVPGPVAGSPVLLVDSDTDVEEDPDVRPLRWLRATQTVPETPDVAAQPPDPDVPGPEARRPALLVDSDTDVEEEGNPDAETLKKLEMTPNVPESPDVVAQTPSPDVGATRNGCRALLVDSDTDVEEEEEEANPDVRPSERSKTPRSVPQTPDVPPQPPPNPAVEGSQGGHGALLDDSDTDVEEEANPDVGSLKRPRPAPNVPETPGVRLKAPNPDVSGTKMGHGTLLVDSETDAEEDETGPDVQPLKRLRVTQNVPRTPDVLPPTLNPAVRGSESSCGTLVGDSDPDVEEGEADPDAQPSKRQKITQNAPVTPDVGLEPPDPDAGGLQRTQNGAQMPDVEGEEEGWDPDVATQLFLPPDPDVAEAEANPDVGSPGLLKGTQKPPEIPDVEEEEEESDLTVATQLFLPSPDAGSPKRPKTTQNPPKIPNVEEETPNADEEEEPDPDVATQLFLPSPDAGSPEGPKTPPKDPQIPDAEGLPCPDPDVATQLFLPLRPGVEEGLNPDVLGPKQPKMASSDPKIPAVRAETPDPDVEGEEDLDVATQLFLPPDPDVEGGEGPSEPDAGSPKPPRSPQNPPGTPDVGTASPDPDVGASPRGCGALLGDADPDVGAAGPSPDVAASEGPQAAPAGPVVPDVGAGAPNPDVEGPGNSALGPDVATQLFLPPAPDVALPESPRGAPDEPRVPDVGEAAPNPDVEGAEAPPTPQVRRSRRLAASGGGGASRGPTPTQNRRGQGSKPRPQRGQDQSAAAVLGEAMPSAPIKGNGRGSVAAPPPEGEEPAEGAKCRLRPRAAPGPAQIRVLFTGLVASPALRVALGTLGGTEATSVHDCSHLVTDGIRRTLKFLCALGRGVPIVTPQWLLESACGGRPLSPGPFLPRDPRCERRFGFQLRPALAQARERPLLQGYQVHVTPSVQPCPEDMRDLVTCCGGTFLPQLPQEYAPRVLVLSCPQDRRLWPPAAAARLPLLSAELLLSGVLRQRLELGRFLLSPWQPPENAPEPPENTPGPTQNQTNATRNTPNPTQNQKNSTQKPPNPTQNTPNRTQNSPNPTQNQKHPTQKPPEPTQNTPNPTQNTPNPTQNQTNPTRKSPNPTQNQKNPTQKPPEPTQNTPNPTQKRKNPPRKTPNPAPKTPGPAPKTPNRPQKQNNDPPKTPNRPQKQNNVPPKTPNTPRNRPNPAPNAAPQSNCRPHLGGSTPPPSPPRTRSGRRPPQNSVLKTPNSGTPQKTQNPPRKTPNPSPKTPKRPRGHSEGPGPDFGVPDPPQEAPRTRSRQGPPQNPPRDPPNSGTSKKPSNPTPKSPNPPQKPPNQPRGGPPGGPNPNSGVPKPPLEPPLEPPRTRSGRRPPPNAGHPQKTPNRPQKAPNAAPKRTRGPPEGSPPPILGSPSPPRAPPGPAAAGGPQ